MSVPDVPVPHGDRVLFVTNGLGRGGAETQLLRIISEVRDQGHEVALGVLNPENDYAEQLATLGLRVWGPPAGAGRWNVRHMLHLARELRSWHPDVTVVFLFQATLFMRGLNLWLRPRRAISSMRNDQLESRLRSVLYRATCRRDDAIVVNSRSAATKLQQLGTIPRTERVKVIYNGIDADLVRSRVDRPVDQTRRELGIAEGETLLLGVGRLHPQKDWPGLLRALATAGRSDLRCVIAGDGYLHDSLCEMAHELGVSESVQFLGLRDDVPDLMAAADRLVLTSRSEGTPNVVLEALALGLTAISTDVGACAELLTRHEDVVVPPNDPAALANALRAIPVRGTGGGSTTQTGDVGPEGMRGFSWSVIGQEWTDLITDR